VWKGADEQERVVRDRGFLSDVEKRVKILFGTNPVSVVFQISIYSGVSLLWLNLQISLIAVPVRNDLAGSFL
jgi:hypothetical protein